MAPAATIDEQFKQISQRDHILMRPDQYIGGVELHHSKESIINADGQVEVRELTYSPAFIQIFDEILVNAADHRRRDRNVNRIEVRIARTTGELSVFNNGQGLPPQRNKDGIYIPELVFGNLLTSSNYDDSQNRTVGGRNGVGAKVTNIYSTKFTVETIGLNETGAKLLYTQSWSDNMGTAGQPTLAPCTRPQSTRITFQPDFTRFHMASLDNDAIDLIRTRVWDVCAVNPEIKVFFGCEDVATCAQVKVDQVPLASFADYAERRLRVIQAPYWQQQQQEQYKAAVAAAKDAGEPAPEPPGEVAAPPRQDPLGKPLYASQIVKIKSGEGGADEVWWEVILGASDGNGLQQLSYVNSINTPSGGTHVAWIVDQVVKAVSAKRNVPKNVTPLMIKKCLSVFVRCLIVNPSFDTQTKNRLNTPAAKFGGPGTGAAGTNQFTLEATTVNNLMKTTFNELIIGANAKATERSLKSSDATGKRSARVDVPKLSDANLAGTPRSKECTLILTEGDSAKALALAGVSAMRQRDTFGVFPLRGKLLNAREEELRVANNAEIGYIKIILGLKNGRDYDTLEAAQKELRYGRLMIMTDQDYDGSHIKGLIINLFHRFWPKLLAAGYVEEFVTPIVRVFKASNRHLEHQFYTIPDYQAWLEGRNDTNGLLIKYYKGLGTSTDKDAADYFADIDHHRKGFVVDATTDERIFLAFDKTQADARKQWLMDLRPGTFLDHSMQQIPISVFIDRELILYSQANVVRSIPSGVDGFKPVQRKIMWYMLLKNVNTDTKVAQLGGKIAAAMAYHHGDVSMSNTIIGMAQSFVGSGNLPLLVPEGQFGTRNMGGEDASAARYLNTYLSPIARFVFPAADDAVLDPQEDDGTPIEPTHLYPVIPLALVNGLHGVATAWSTEVPCYDPLALIDAMRAVLTGHACPHLAPFYLGHTGQVTPDPRDPARWCVPGRLVFEENGADFVGSGPMFDEMVGDGPDDELIRLRITELPVSVWTEKYIDSVLRPLLPEDKAAKVKPAERGARGAATRGTARGGARGGAAAATTARGRGAAAAASASGAGDDPSSGAGAASKVGIESYEEQHGPNTIDFRITMKRGQLKAAVTKDPSLMKFFKLEGGITTTNMHMIAADLKVYRYKNPESVVYDFFFARMEKYVQRREAMLAAARAALARARARCAFIEAVIDTHNPLVIAKRPTDDIVREMWTRQIEPKLEYAAELALAADAAANNKRFRGLERGQIIARIALEPHLVFLCAADAPALLKMPELASKGYSEHLGLPLRTLTAEQVAKLRQQMAEAERALALIEGTDAAEMWWEDLARLEIALKEIRRREMAMQQEAARKADAARARRAAPRARGKAVVRVAETEVDMVPFGSAIKITDQMLADRVAASLATFTGRTPATPGRLVPSDTPAEGSDVAQIVQALRSVLGAGAGGGIVRAEAVTKLLNRELSTDAFRTIPLGREKPPKEPKAPKEPKPPKEPKEPKEPKTTTRARKTVTPPALQLELVADPAAAALTTTTEPPTPSVAPKTRAPAAAAPAAPRPPRRARAAVINLDESSENEYTVVSDSSDWAPSE